MLKMLRKKRDNILVYGCTAYKETNLMDQIKISPPLGIMDLNLKNYNGREMDIPSAEAEMVY